MSKSTFNALASLAILAAAPMAAQAEMTEMADTELAGVAGQGPIANLIDVLTPGPGTPGGQGNPISYIDTDNDGDIDQVTYAYDPGSPDKFIGTTIAGAIGETAGDATQNAIGFGLLPFTGPISALGAFNGRVLDNASDVGTGVADIAFYGPFRALELAGNILAAPVNFVFNPLDRALAGVTGRFEATVDGAAYAFTEVKGALIAGAFASASQGAANNGLDFTARVLGRISQAQAGLTNNRLSALADKYGY
ncbi:MAG TPA: hypothetical protein VNK45_05735 [Candidatus Acidoferrales bacterium]|nr:hypothetical protein [Candidatus Acidoferrales bacterium]